MSTDNYEIDRVVGDQVAQLDPHIRETARVNRAYQVRGAIPYHLRSPAAFAAFYDGLELVEPGLVAPSDWRPGTPPAPEAAGFGGLAGIARKP